MSNEEIENKFRDFNWENEGWLSYYRNLYPTPTSVQLSKWKRKWYKRNIDGDISLEDPTVSRESTSRSPPMSTSSQQGYTNSSENTHRRSHQAYTAISQYMYISIYLQLLSLLINVGNITPFAPTPFKFNSFTYSQYILRLALILELYTIYGLPKLSTQWITSLLPNKSFSLLFYTLAVRPLPFNVLYFAVTSISILISLQTLINNPNNHILPQLIQQNPHFKLLMTHLGSQKEQLYSTQAYIQLLYTTTVVMNAFKPGGLFSLILYFYFLRYSYNYFYYMRIHLTKIKNNISTYIIPHCPQIIQNTYYKVLRML